MRKAPNYYRKGASECAQGENKEESKDMEAGVVRMLVRIGAALRFLVIVRLSPNQFGAEELVWEI